MVWVIVCTCAGYVNLQILHMLEGTFSLSAAQSGTVRFYVSGCKPEWWSKTACQSSKSSVL